MISRIASEHPDNRARSGKLISMLHCSLTGTIFVYESQEAGQINVPPSWGEEEYKDIESIQLLEGERDYLKRSGITGREAEEYMKGVFRDLRMTARDNGRTPVQWDATENAGFTQGKPWMRIHEDYKTWNVEAQVKDPDSVVNFWKRMLALRKEHLALVYGKFTLLDAASDDNIIFTREWEETGEKLLVVLNLKRGEDRMGAPITVDLAKLGVDTADAKLLVSNDDAKEGSGVDGPVELAPWSGRVYVLQEGKKLAN